MQKHLDLWNTVFTLRKVLLHHSYEHTLSSGGEAIGPFYSGVVWFSLHPLLLTRLDTYNAAEQLGHS